MSVSLQQNAVKATTVRLDFIDALRGFACLWVVLYHSHLAFLAQAAVGERQTLPAWLAKPLIGFTLMGGLGVNLFLVLSGFCLFYPLVRKQAVSEITLNLREFARRRCRRILPPYYAAVLIFSALNLSAFLRGIWASPGSRGEVLFIDLPAHLLMLHNLWPRTVFSINPSFWSLALEFQLYLVFPLLVWLAGRGGLRLLLIAPLLVSVAWHLFVAQPLETNASVNVTGVLLGVLPARAFEFAAGMTAAAMVARPAPRQRLFGALGMGCCAALLLYAPPFDKATGSFLPEHCLWGILFAGLIVCAYDATRRLPLIDKYAAGFTRVGVISYSVYLIHQPLLGVIGFFVLPFHLSYTASLALWGFVILPFLILLGSVFFYYFERPFLNSQPGGKGASGLSGETDSRQPLLLRGKRRSLTAAAPNQR